MLYWPKVTDFGVWTVFRNVSQFEEALSTSDKIIRLPELVYSIQLASKIKLWLLEGAGVV